MKEGSQNSQEVYSFVAFLKFLLILIISVSIVIFVSLAVIPISIENPLILNNCSIGGEAKIINEPIICYNCSFKGNTTLSIDNSTNFCNCSIGGNITIQNFTPLTFRSCLNGENSTSILDLTSKIFSSSGFSTILQSYFTEGGLLNLIANNFTIFLAIIGLLSFYCYFYFNITFNADVISEYSESQQRNLKVVFQAFFPTLFLLIFYVISVRFFGLDLKPIEIVLVLIFFGLELFTSLVFFEYVTKIHSNFYNLVQFAAVRDSNKIFGRDFVDFTIYNISILLFVFPFLVIFYGIVADFKIFSIVFIIILPLIMIWELNIINNAPRRIYNIKIKNSETVYNGLILTKPEKETIQILVDFEKNGRKIQIPKTSIEYIAFNREITEDEINTPRWNYSRFFSSMWNLSTSLRTILGFEFGLIFGALLFFVVLIVASRFPLPVEILCVIFAVIAFILGFVCGRFHLFHRYDVFNEGWLRYDSEREDEWRDLFE